MLVRAKGIEGGARREFLRSLTEGVVLGALLVTAALVAVQLHDRVSLTWSIIILLGGGLAVALTYTYLRIKRMISARLDPSMHALFERLTYGLPGMLYQYRQYPTGRGSVTLSNEAIREIYELDPESARRDGVQIMRLVHPEDRERIWKSLVYSHTHLAPWREEYRVILPKAGIVWRYADAFVERLPDGGTLWHGYIVDITREKALRLSTEEAKRRAESVNLTRTRFLAMLSHDMRTPMNGILGYVGLLRRTDLSATQREYVSSIEGCTNNLLRLVNDVLDLSRLEDDRLTMGAQQFRIRGFLDEVVQMIRPRAEEKGIRLAVSYAADTPDGIEVDRLRLWQVLTNLMSNAVKFTDFGGIALHVSCRQPEKADDRAEWTFSLRDTGAGIAREKLAMIFEPFVQLETAEVKEGVGLGLTIAKQLCGQMGGYLKVESEVGKGSTFTARIKGRIVDDLPEVSHMADDEFSSSARVLVVDDQAVNTKVAELLLKRMGCDVLTANDGMSAIQINEGRPSDVIFLDLQMPGLDGLAVARKIRASRIVPGVRPMIVALTGSVAHADYAACLAAGMDDCLEKPLNETRLIEVLRKVGAVSSGAGTVGV